MSRTFTGEQVAAKVKAAADNYGITTFKIKVGKRMGNNTDQWPNRTQEVVAAVRAAVPDAILMADANGAFHDSGERTAHCETTGCKQISFLRGTGRILAV